MKKRQLDRNEIKRSNKVSGEKTNEHCWENMSVKLIKINMSCGSFWRLLYCIVLYDYYGFFILSVFWNGRLPIALKCTQMHNYCARMSLHDALFYIYGKFEESLISCHIFVTELSYLNYDFSALKKHTENEALLEWAHFTWLAWIKWCNPNEEKKRRQK